MKSLLIPVFQLCCFIGFTQPIISSFTPAAGPIGSTVLIQGTNFNTIPENNIVYFGAVKGIVSYATTTSISVIVPAGASFKPMTVTTGGLTAYSAKPFNITFNSVPVINAASFAPKIDSTTGAHPICVATGDLDNDGRPDIVTANNTSNSISIIRNTESNGMISFGQKIDYATDAYPQNVSIADIDGDGLLDILTTNSSTDSVSIFRNTTVNNILSFAGKISLAAGADPSDIGIGDFDGDGKQDIAVVNYNSFSISVFRNTGNVGAISFASKVDFFTGSLLPWRIALGDLDEDGKTDMIVSDYTSVFDSISVFKNTSNIGTISFANKVDYPKARGALGVATADFDGDGKLDIAATCYVSNKVSVLRNTGGNGVISFAPKVDFVTGSFPESISICDMDGDGKPDISSGNFNANSISLLKNSSFPGTIIFMPKTDYATGTNPKSLLAIDLNKDGKPDWVTANINSDNISIIRNKITAIQAGCSGDNANLTSNLSGSNYQWQQSTDSINFFNITDNSNFTGSQNHTLQINNLVTEWYGYQYRCIVDGVTSDAISIQFKNLWTGLIDSVWENAGNWSCGVLPDSNTDVVLNGSTIVLSTSVNIRSITLSAMANFTITPGANLSVKQ